ncbi:MAG: glycosyltransferase family 2 protein, partial [Bacteroidota bacterium]
MSILIPAKNEAAFIEELLRSIQAQTHECWEAIFVDDHSTDQSVAVVTSFSKLDSRIKCVTNEGVGIIQALRTAYSHATGNWITRMDADDRMKPRKLEVLLGCLDSNGSKAVAVGGVQYFCDEGLKSGYKNYEKWLNALTRNGTNFQEIFRECVIPSPCWMMK